MQETYEYIPLETNRSEASHNLIMLHGYGSDGFDLLHIGNLWQQTLPNLGIYSLQAPEPCQDVPSGRQWFYIKDMDPHTLYRGAQNASKYLERALLNAVEHTKVPLENTILMGFSQGAMMALYTGLYRCPQVRGILAYSGGIFSPDEPLIEAKDIDICLIHGDADTVVPLPLFEASSHKLKAEGLKVEEHLLPGLEHSIDDRAFRIGEAFLQQAMMS